MLPQQYSRGNARHSVVARQSEAAAAHGWQQASIGTSCDSGNRWPLDLTIFPAAGVSLRRRLGSLSQAGRGCCGAGAVELVQLVTVRRFR